MRIDVSGFENDILARRIVGNRKRNFVRCGSYQCGGTYSERQHDLVHKAPLVGGMVQHFLSWSSAARLSDGATQQAVLTLSSAANRMAQFQFDGRDFRTT